MGLTPTPMTLAGALLPPALVTYFLWAHRRSLGVISPRVWAQSQALGISYSIAIRLIIVITVLFLRSYLSPRKQSVPPPETPVEHASGESAREPDGPVRVSTLSSLGSDAAQLRRLAGERARVLGRYSGEDSGDSGGVNQDVLVLPEWCGRCSRTRPARTRHCRECGVCRMGFDHHCAFFGNCLTAPYSPCFLALLFLTPLVVVSSSLPTYAPLYARGRVAWTLAPEWWWSAWWSWIFGGPLGRWMGGIALGWRESDISDPSEESSVEIAALIFIGQILGLMILASGYTTASALSRGQFTVDLARAKSFARDPERFAQITRLYIPLLPVTPSSSPPSPTASPVPPLGSGSPVKDTGGGFYDVPGYTSYGNEVAGVLVTSREMNSYDTPATCRWVLRGKARFWRVLRSEWRDEELMHWPIRRDVLRDVQRQKERWLQ